MIVVLLTGLIAVNLAACIAIQIAGWFMDDEEDKGKRSDR